MKKPKKIKVYNPAAAPTTMLFDSLEEALSYIRVNPHCSLLEKKRK